MTLAKHYDGNEMEPRLLAYWQEAGIYHFSEQSPLPVYSIDTPPPTVSGNLHLGHVYSYSHADFIARFMRMNGYNIFYPMGFDDNGLPTERLVEKRYKVHALQIGRQAFIQKCLEVSEESEKDYRTLWQRLGLSIDWRYTYRTIDDSSRRISQLSFIQLYRKGRVERRNAPALWCPECRTSIAQAELNDLLRPSEYVTLPFNLEDGRLLPIATTRPELLSACVAVFVHPEDGRYRGLVGQQVSVPFYGQRVTVLIDPAADPQKGTGAVMCCTFGDQTDMAWWYAHKLPLVEAIDPQGRMTAAAGELEGLTVSEARRRIKELLEVRGLILGREPTEQSVRVHERCDTPVEHIIIPQWFIRLLDQKGRFLAAGDQLNWHPEHMLSRYRAWVENLSWDWCLSRQRYFGVPFPIWYCAQCGAVMLAEEDSLPVDPLVQQPDHPCTCGSTKFIPDADIMDTWATSSLSPLIVCHWLEDGPLFQKTFPMSMRPQAHEIIRTWAFYSIVKSLYHFNRLPWKDVFISGWGIAGEGMGKVSKSRGGGPMPPLEMIEKYSADAVRYWAASTGPGKDAVISEEKIQVGTRLLTKLWNVARFSQPFLENFVQPTVLPEFTLADRWILARTMSLVRRVTGSWRAYEYAMAKSETEAFFWHDLADNYLEMAKQRLYDSHSPAHSGARFALWYVFQVVLKLFAPFLPYITEAIYQEIFAANEMVKYSIHRTDWPQPDALLEDPAAEAAGERLVEVASAVRRYKSEHNLGLGIELSRLALVVDDPDLARNFRHAQVDLSSVSRARQVEIVSELDPSLVPLDLESEGIHLAVSL